LTKWKDKTVPRFVDLKVVLSFAGQTSLKTLRPVSPKWIYTRCSLPIMFMRGRKGHLLVEVFAIVVWAPSGAPIRQDHHQGVGATHIETLRNDISCSSQPLSVMMPMSWVRGISFDVAVPKVYVELGTRPALYGVEAFVVDISRCSPDFSRHRIRQGGC
jgi:hypothetical protein